MPLVRAYSRDLGQHSISTRKGTFFWKKGTKNFTSPFPHPPPYSVSLLSVLHRKKAFYNSCKRRQRSIVEHNIGLEYTLLVASSFHILTALSHPLRKNANDSKSYVPPVPMIISFKVFKYFFSGKISFFLSACLW